MAAVTVRIRRARPVPIPPNFIREAPEPPDWLDEGARAEWDRVVPELDALSLLKAPDCAVLVGDVETWSRFVMAATSTAGTG